ncbi:unnamed protein product [Arctia plantaginis]|uniref:Arrestin C-terminal-like domain-containing protein n=1 Tax=Arctia plantaginis TaxID=874455 RepID=A0A8S1AC30_ARCPL|nr:unnamed protein product [Arctia plantaginis]
MGIISCQMCIFKPPDEVYKQGEVVAGLIKYTILEPVEIQKITTSLKGIGTIVLKVHRGTKNRVTYKSKETLVDIDNIVQDEKMKLESGSHEIKFHFTLPDTIPSTSKICKCFGNFKATCVIKYYIRIKLQGSGLFSIEKHFRKEIPVKSDVAPTLSREPVNYMKSKKLVRLFSSQNGLINIKATILNSALAIGGKIVLHYEVKNDSHVIVKSVQTKLIQAYMFKADGRSAMNYEEDVPSTEAKITSIDSQTTRTECIDIQLPSNIYNLENSKLLSRYYFVRLIAQLPLPHGNVVLNIPVQIGVKENANDNKMAQDYEDIIDDDPPPSYWEVMGEARKENDESSDDDDDENHKSKTKK